MKFKCLASGTVIEFTQEHDVKAMLKHPQYVVVEEPKEEVVAEAPKSPVEAKAPVKKSYKKD